MKITVDKDLCTGCGLCVSSCPDVFEMDDDNNVAVVISSNPEDSDCAQQAAEDCPLEAIKVGK